MNDIVSRQGSPPGSLSGRRTLEAAPVPASARDRQRPRVKAASVLLFAAAPTFGIMALLTAAQSAAMPDVLCSSSRGGWFLTGMVPMYSLMSAFHLTPWLKFVGGRQGFAHHDQQAR
jgi:hypothetical protein